MTPPKQPLDLRSVPRMVRFVMVGASTAIIYTVLAALLVEFGYLTPIMASVLAYAAAVPISYLLHSRFTFHDRPKAGATPVRFVVTTAGGFLISTGSMYVASHLLGHSYWLGILITWALVPAANYMIHLFWTFKVDRLAEAERVHRARAGGGLS